MSKRSRLERLEQKAAPAGEDDFIVVTWSDKPDELVRLPSGELVTQEELHRRYPNMETIDVREAWRDK